MLHLRPDTLLPKRLDFDLTVNIGDAPVTVGELSYIREDVLEDMVQQRVMVQLSYIREDVLENMVQQRVKEAIEAGERQNFNCRCVAKPVPEENDVTVLELDAIEPGDRVYLEKYGVEKINYVVYRGHGMRDRSQRYFRLVGGENSKADMGFIFINAESYKMTWRCWDHMPTAEERAAHPWKEAT